MSPACAPGAPRPLTAAQAAQQERGRLGLPDGREREPGAEVGWRWWPAVEGPPADLIQMAEFEAALREGNDLAVGVAIPGAPGACITCHHAKTWHKDCRRACEICACTAFGKPARIERGSAA